MLAVESLRALGYQRPGLCGDPASDQEVARAQQAGFLLAQQPLPARDRLPVLTGMEPARFQKMVADQGRDAPFLFGLEQGPFEKWFRRHRPDAVISSFRLLLDYLKQMDVKVGRETGFSSLNRVGDMLGLAGVNQHHERIAAAAVNVVARKFERSEIGLSPQPETTVFRGSWHEGATAPEI